jgi:hypothetical protein
VRTLAGDRHPERCQPHMGRQQTPIQTAQGGDRTMQSIWCAEYTSPKLDALPQTPPLRHPRQARRCVNGRRTSVGNARGGRDCMKRKVQGPTRRDYPSLWERPSRIAKDCCSGSCGPSTPPRKRRGPRTLQERGGRSPPPETRAVGRRCSRAAVGVAQAVRRQIANQVVSQTRDLANGVWP